MIGSIARMYAYSKAPRTTFALRHPWTAFRLGKAKWDLKHAVAPRIAAIGAVAVALPIGLWLGSRRNGHDEA
jgi:hypothetical protein